MVVETLIMLCVTESSFVEKLFLPPKLGWCAKNKFFLKKIKSNLVTDFH